jgi:hypothetical protein
MHWGSLYAMGRLAIAIGGLLAGLAPVSPSLAQAADRGATLDPARAPNFNSDCTTMPQPIADPSLQYVPVASGQPSCTWWQTGVFGAPTDPRSGYVPGDGVITTVTVRSGPNPAPIRFAVVRQLTQATAGIPSGDPECCFFVRETAPVQPAANALSTFTVNLPVESNRAPSVVTNDLIAISALSGTGSLPIFAVPGQTNANSFTQPGTVDASATFPAIGALANDTGGGRRPAGFGGFELQLRYTFVPASGGNPGPPIKLGPTDITTIGGGVLRPIGGALDVTLNCLQITCAGSVKLLTRSPVVAASARSKKIRSLGTQKFSLKQGNGRKVHVVLNALGRKLAKSASTKVTVVVDLGSVGKTSRNLTLRRGTAKRR